MQKTYCDKCGKEIVDYRHLRIEYSDKKSITGTKNLFFDFCKECQAEFIGIIKNFIPNKFDE